MSEASPDRDEEMLARLAEFDLAAAERVHGRLMAADEVSEIAELGRTYQRVARSLRQTLALKAKLKADREAVARTLAQTAQARPPAASAVARRNRELHEAVSRVIWSEAESPDAATFLEEMLDDVLTQEMLDEAFCDAPLDNHVARLCADLDLSPAAAERWRDLPEPSEAEDEAPPDEADHRSSG